MIDIAAAMKRAEHLAKGAGVNAPARVLDQDGALADEFVAFCDQTGASLDWIFRGVKPEGRSMNEGQIYTLARKAAYLHAVIISVRDDYGVLRRHGMVREFRGITECDRLPTFLDLAEELAGEIAKIGDELADEADGEIDPTQEAA